MDLGGRDLFRRKGAARSVARLLAVAALLVLGGYWLTGVGQSPAGDRQAPGPASQTPYATGAGGSSASAAQLSASSAQQNHKKPWLNYDTDTWGGSSDPSNPASADNPAGCDPIDPAQCMLPYPDDFFTRPDTTSATGRRLDFNVLAMPRNIAGRPIDPSDYNRSDGFSPGSTMLTVVPGMTKNTDLASSDLPTDQNMDPNGDPAHDGVVLIDATTGAIWPAWVELDQYTGEAGVLPAGATGPVQQDLMIHPAKNLLNGHRYVVALRHLHTDSGTTAQPGTAFESLVEGFGAAPPCATLGKEPAAGDSRALHMDRIFCDLEEAGWAVSGDASQLYLAWDFTVASTQNVTGRMLAIRDNAFEQLGETQSQIDSGASYCTNAAGATTWCAGKAPAFTVSSVTNFQDSDPAASGYNPLVAREIQGSFSVPCYIAPTCSPPLKCKDISSSSPFDDCPSPGSFFYTDPTNPDADPTQVPGQSYTADYICVAGRNAFDAQKALRPVEYGHGLFGSYTEVTVSAQEEMADRQGMLYCATDWFGWSNSDIPNAVIALADLSNFKILADEGQQGELDFLYLQRLMINPSGFASNPAFQYASGTPIINLSDGVYYDGNSQGGIFGGTVCAVSIDARRCALGVNGMDYSTLLPRSVDYVATSTLPQFLQQNIEAFAANPTGYDPTSLTGVGYSNAFDLFYPDQAQRQLTLDIIQTVWDRADPDGYAGNMTSSSVGGLLPDCGQDVVAQNQTTNDETGPTATCPAGTPDHHVLMQIAWGDHQVANFTAFDEARTIGAESVGNSGGTKGSNTLKGGEALLASRLCNTDPTLTVDGTYCYQADSPLWGITPISAYPYDGSAIAIFDAGPIGDGTAYATDPPPPSDVPPPDTSGNRDPHEAPRRTCAAQDMKGAFFDTFGQVTGLDGYVTDPPQLLTGFVAGFTGTLPPSSGTLAGPPYFSGGWQGACALP